MTIYLSLANKYRWSGKDELAGNNARLFQAKKTRYFEQAFNAEAKTGEEELGTATI